MDKKKISSTSLSIGKKKKEEINIVDFEQVD